MAAAPNHPVDGVHAPYYGFARACFSAALDTFFREVKERGAHKIPATGPVIFVCAPHANQFVDPLILIKHARRQVGFLAAKKSMDKRWIGLFARSVGSIPVVRPQDMTKKGTGKLYVSDATGDMKTIKGVDTAFKKELAPRTALTFAGENLEVVEVISDTEVTVKAPVKGTKAIAALTATEKLESGESKPLGVSFKFAPHVDQGEMFATVIARLNAGGCVGIFPEGGSHDRSEFLPLKPGVAMMALGAMAQNETLDVKIIPCGLNYFHADKFRSRAVIEFGDPITVPTEAVEMYRKGGPDRRAAVGSLLDTIFKSLKSVAVTAPDYDTLMVVQAARRLYRPLHAKMTIDEKLVLARRFAEGFEKYRNDPKIQELFTRVQDYNKLLGYYGIRDHQVLKTSIGGVSALVKLVTRLLEVLCLFALAAPGAILHYPILYVSNTYAAQKAIEAKRDSSVKLEGKDVVATWKILIALVLTPACYTLYNLIFFLYLYLFSSYTFYPRALFCLVFSIVCPLFGWAAVRASEIGFDIFHSLKPLFLAIFPSSAEPLRLMRADLTARINALIEDLGPAMFGGKEEFDAVRIVKQEDVNYGESRQEKLNRGIDDSFRWDELDDVFLFKDDKNHITGSRKFSDASLTRTMSQSSIASPSNASPTK